MKSRLHTSASLLLKVAYEDGSEKIIGYAKNLTFNVSQGQKMTYVVDSPLPAEIAQGTAQSFVSGSLTTFLPKGTTPEAAGLVPYRIDEFGDNVAALSKYIHFRLYDRATLNLVFAAEYCKVGNYSVSVTAKGVVEVNLQFQGLYLTPGLTL